VIGSGKPVAHSMGRRFKSWSGRRSARGCALLLACAGLALTLGVGALFAGSAPSFAAPRDYATDYGSESVAIGDLNGDGKPDLATANRNGDTGNVLSVLLNRGDGIFRSPLYYQPGDSPYSIEIGDLNGDGKPDLVTANPVGNSVSVFLNRGDGSFQTKLDYAAGREPRSVAIGDLNGDGKLDIAVANASANTVSVLLSRGDGRFETKLDYATGRRPFSVAIGDFNGDGKPDLAIANGRAGTVSVLLNRGDGFHAKLDYRTGGAGSVAIGDLNGDGKPDLATANDLASTVSVLLNSGDGTFKAKREYAAGGGPESVAIGDLNGDGEADLATANLGGTVSVLANKGDGRFQAKLDYSTGHERWSVAIGDLNGDRRQDLATANADEDGTGSVSVLLNTPGLCTVQGVKGQTVPAAKRTIVRANCRVGKIRRAYSKAVKRGRVISQKPRFGAVLRGGGKVNLVVSRGRKHL
jgi:FG-GAP-like repeat/FG-GAP repeat/PASTA domain